MKATGIVRRIDDLGRIVIPKEIRKMMKVKEGDLLEIYTERDGIVCFKKYSPTADYDNEFKAIVKTLDKYGIKGAIYDNSEERVYASDPGTPIDCPYDVYNSNHYAIRVDGDVWGHFIVNRTVNEEEDRLIKFAINMFIRCIEI